MGEDTMTMIGENESTKLPPQQPVTPPDRPAEAPALGLYAILAIVAVLLILAAFIVRSANLAGLLLNLGTELAGAVVILILVERRLRPRDLQMLEAVAGSARRRLMILVSREARQMVTYARVLRGRLAVVAALPFYFERPTAESTLRAGAANGLLFLGRAGDGKTTLLHHLASETTVALERDPLHGAVPVVVALRRLDDREIIEQVFSELRKYSSIDEQTFRRLTATRLMCLFDGLDEVLDPPAVAAALAAFKKSFPATRLVVTSRSTLEPSVQEILQLQVATLPALSREESERLKDAYRRHYS